MLSQTATIWASAAGATVLVGGAVAAIYLAHPAFLWPAAPPAALTAQAPAPPAPAVPSPARPPPVVSAAPAAPAPSAAVAPPPPVVVPPAPAKPSFDVVNVEPTGETVVAGRAAPDAKVELKDSGKVLAGATANARGEFVIIPPILTPGEHSLALSTGAGASAQTSNAISVAVAVPEPAPKAAGAPSTASPDGKAGTLAIRSVEASSGGRLIARGDAPPNAVVRLYLSGAYVGDAKTAADGRWSLTIESGLTPGGYMVRADELDPNDAKVRARAEAPFNYPATASAAPSAPTGAPSAPAETADVVVGSVQTHHVDPGNTLWGISQKFYGDGSRYEVIYAANSGQIRDPHWIYPGQVLVVPKEAPKP